MSRDIYSWRRKNLEENELVIDTIENLVVFKAIYKIIYILIATSLHKYLKSILKQDLDTIESALRQIDFENEYNTKDIVDYFN